VSTILSSWFGGSGWRRIAFVNITDPSHVCPARLSIVTHPRRLCGSFHDSFVSCSFTIFAVDGLAYSQVCGRILAYQSGAVVSFNQHTTFNQDIEGSYVDGVSLTHGAAGQRKHIWTFELYVK